MAVLYRVDYECEGQECNNWTTVVPVGPAPPPLFGESIVLNPLANPVTLPDVVTEIIKNRGFYRGKVFTPYHAIRSIIEVENKP
jgi:hypothetical protein